jgi:hypothetical protein
MSISKKMRFEVFKRDSFTCQYCGAKAPDVVLHADHVEPVKEGGKDSILNLVTACFGCNSGKGALRLSDESALQKSRKQAELLQERREQIEMIAMWHKELVENESLATLEVAKNIPMPEDRSLNEQGLKSISRWIRKFGMAEVLTASKLAFEQYYSGDLETWEKAFHKVAGIARCREIERNDPVLAKAYLYRGVLRNRLSYVGWDTVLDWLCALLEKCGEEVTGRICRSAKSWNHFKTLAQSALEPDDSNA